MKRIKKFLPGLLAISFFTSFGNKLEYIQESVPPDNLLAVSGLSGKIQIKWVANGNNPHGAMLLPVQVKGITKTVYMQLDFGSPKTVFYKKSLQSIPRELADGLIFKKDSREIGLDFSIKRMKISSASFRLLDYGDRVDFKNPKAPNIIGTIGTDLLKERIIVLNFKRQRCSFIDKIRDDGFSPFEFKQGRILLPAMIGNENVKVLYDSGASGYQLITSKDIWERYRIVTGKSLSERVNSWGDTLTIVSAPGNKDIHFGAAKLRLSTVTYVEGISALNMSLMKRSGMQGMIGNKLFLNSKITLDCKKQRFKVE
jgi:hypothetical protein